MVDIIKQGTEEGLRLLDQRGLDLTAQTPDYQKPRYPEDASIFGFSASTPTQIAQAKLQRQRDNLNKLSTMFQISDKVIKTAHTLDEKKRQDYLKNVLPNVERVYPGASKQIKIFANNKSGYQDVLKNISDPQVQAVARALGGAGDFEGAMRIATAGVKRKTTDPQVVSPTKQEREQINRFIERSWPENVPDLGEQQTDFIDILGNRAKKVARKKKISLDDALNEVWPDVYKENVSEGEVKKLFGIDILSPDEPTSLKARQEVQKIVEEYTKDNPAAVTSKEEFDKLPVGSWFINPSDNRLLRKKGGQ